MTFERVELAVWMVKTFAYHNYQWRRGAFEKKTDLFWKITLRHGVLVTLRYEIFLT